MTDKTKELKDIKNSIAAWHRLILNKPVLANLTGHKRELADDLLASKLIWLDGSGCIRSTLAGRRRLKMYRSRLKKAEKGKRDERIETGEGPGLGGQEE